MKFAASTFTASSLAVCTFNAPIEKLPALPVMRPPAWIGMERPASSPIRRLKNRYGVSPTPALRPERLPSRKREGPLPFEEELALLGKEQTEARQVHLLLVDLDLREIGVVR